MNGFFFLSLNAFLFFFSFPLFVFVFLLKPFFFSLFYRAPRQGVNPDWPLSRLICWILRGAPSNSTFGECMQWCRTLKKWTVFECFLKDFWALLGNRLCDALRRSDFWMLPHSLFPTFLRQQRKQKSTFSDLKLFSTSPFFCFCFLVWS